VAWPIIAPRWGALGGGRKPRPLAWVEGSRTFGPNLRGVLSPVPTPRGPQPASSRERCQASRPADPYLRCRDGRAACTSCAHGLQITVSSGRNSPSHRGPREASRPKEVRHETPRSLRRPPLLSSLAVSAGRVTRPKPASSGGRRLCTETKSFLRSWDGTTHAPAAQAAAFKNCCLPTGCFRGQRARLLLLGTELASGRCGRPNGPGERSPGLRP
jgi:hypothetical protein